MQFHWLCCAGKGSDHVCLTRASLRCRSGKRVLHCVPLLFPFGGQSVDDTGGAFLFIGSGWSVGFLVFPALHRVGKTYKNVQKSDLGCAVYAVGLRGHFFFSYLFLFGASVERLENGV